MEEHRNTMRRRLFKAGKITLPGGGVIDCTVRNLSQTGAALDVTSPIGIPETFVLVIESDHAQLQCRVAWRKEGRIGVSFVGA